MLQEKNEKQFFATVSALGYLLKIARTFSNPAESSTSQFKEIEDEFLVEAITIINGHHPEQELMSHAREYVNQHLISHNPAVKKSDAIRSLTVFISYGCAREKRLLLTLLKKLMNSTLKPLPKIWNERDLWCYWISGAIERGKKSLILLKKQ